MTDIPDFEIHGQQATTIRLVDGDCVQIDQEDPDARHGVIGITIWGPANVDLLIRALRRCKREMEGRSHECH